MITSRLTARKADPILRDQTIELSKHGSADALPPTAAPFPGGIVAFRLARGVRASARRLTGVVAILFVSVSTAQAEERPRGESGSAARHAAQRALPWHSLAGPRREAVARVVNDASLFRRLPTRVIDCDAEVFNHLLEHPELIVETWNLMGVSKVGLRRTGHDTYTATDAAGGQGSIQVLDRQRNADGSTHVLAYAKGVYQAPPMPRPITATTVLMMRSLPRTEANGRTYITTDLDTFIRLDRVGAELVLRTLHPIVTRTADHNFVETMRFVSLFSRTAEQNPEGMARLTGRLNAVEPAARQRFAEIGYRAAQRSETRRDERLRLASASPQR